MHVIAEAGNNHNGDVEVARRLIDTAVDAGADSVKFQLIHPERLYLPEFPTDGGYEQNPVIDARRKHMLSADDYRSLADHCRERGIGFSASAFDVQGAELLVALGADYIKIASCDLDNIELVRQVVELGLPVILSTGMASMEEVAATVEAAKERASADLVLLHCVSVYPAELSQMNLRFIEELARFDLPVGLSDHTRGTEAAAIGLALGARWFEKHFTLDRTQEGFDHAYALEPDELAAYVDRIHAAGEAIAPRDRKVGEQEREVAERARRSIYAARDLREGETLRAEDLLVVRPSGELKAADYDLVVGKRLREPLRRYEPVTWKAVGA